MAYVATGAGPNLTGDPYADAVAIKVYNSPEAQKARADQRAIDSANRQVKAAAMGERIAHDKTDRLVQYVMIGGGILAVGSAVIYWQKKRRSKA